MISRKDVYYNNRRWPHFRVGTRELTPLAAKLPTFMKPSLWNLFLNDGAYRFVDVYMIWA